MANADLEAALQASDEVTAAQHLGSLLTTLANDAVTIPPVAPYTGTFINKAFTGATLTTSSLGSPRAAEIGAP